MSAGSFDQEGFLRAIFSSIGTGLVVGAIGYFVVKEKWPKWKHALIMGTSGAAILVGVIIYFAWPSLIDVPSLDGLSKAQAEDLLAKNNLRSEAMPQYANGVEPGRVIPDSQNPQAGLLVRPGSLVSFAVNVQQQPPVPPPPPDIVVTLFQPQSGGKALCFRGGDNVYRFEVKGTSSGISTSGYGLLLWLKSVSPPSDTAGWYLQRPPGNGIDKIETDGSWAGIAQIGNATWPPHEGDTFDLAVTLVDSATINKLMAEQGVVIRSRPVGDKIQTANGVVVTLR